MLVSSSLFLVPKNSGCGGRDRTSNSRVTDGRDTISPHRSGTADSWLLALGVLIRTSPLFSHVIFKPLTGVEPAGASLQKRPVTFTPRRFSVRPKPSKGIEPFPAPYRGAVRAINTGTAISPGRQDACATKRRAGVEPAFRAWHARALPLSYVRIFSIPILR